LQLTNSAHDTGVVSECEKGNCMKELEVQFSSSNSSDETERRLKERARSNSFSNTIIQILPDHAIEWHGLGGAIATHETLRSSLCIAFVA
jgi:hypothetical protein